MLNWIREITQSGYIANQIESDEYHVGFEFIFPPEIREVLSGKSTKQPLNNVKDVSKAVKIKLDEYELALS